MTAPSAMRIEELRAALIHMAATDQRVRAELAEEGTLFAGYHPRMASVHHENAARLASILDEVGWPSAALVGQEACDAAWLVLQHSIGDPPVMRRGLARLTAAPADTISPAQLAMLEDRVRTMSGHAQRYGTQFDWNEHGVLAPRDIEDPADVEARRLAVGLPPLADKIREMQDLSAREHVHRPADFAERRREIDRWEISVGWHK